MLSIRCMRFHPMLTKSWLGSKKSLKYRHSKGNYSSITDDNLKIHMHIHTMIKYIQYKFHEIPPIGYRVMGEDGKKSLTFRPKKGNHSAIPDGSSTKLYMHNLTMVIYVLYKYHEIPFIGYLYSYG